MERNGEIVFEDEDEAARVSMIRRSVGQLLNDARGTFEEDVVNRAWQVIRYEIGNVAEASSSSGTLRVDWHVRAAIAHEANRAQRARTCEPYAKGKGKGKREGKTSVYNADPPLGRKWRRSPSPSPSPSPSSDGSSDMQPYDDGANRATVPMPGGNNSATAVDAQLPDKARNSNWRPPSDGGVDVQFLDGVSDTIEEDPEEADCDADTQPKT